MTTDLVENNGGTLSDKAYSQILEALFSGKIPAGAIVTQNELVKMLGVPVQPLRDALRVLQAEGVVVIHSRSGVEFLKPDMEFARSTYQFRSIIESAGVRVFAESVALEKVDRLITGHREALDLVEAEGVSERVLEMVNDLEQKMHGEIVAALRNPLIEVTASRLKNYMSLVRLDRIYTKPILARTLREHLDVLDACARHDADKAEEALVMHFRQALNRAIGMI